MDKELQKDFQQRPLWVFVTLIIILIGASPAFSELVLDFFPNWIDYKKWIKLIIMFFLLGFVYWKEKQKNRDPDKISEDELLHNKPLVVEKFLKKAKWMIWRQNIFKYYPLNVITGRFIPLFICWIISFFINNKYKSFWVDSFYFPKYWKEYNYEEIISKFFKSMCRISIIKEDIYNSYEVKFARDFQHIELRWLDKKSDNKTFSEPINKSYEKIFSEDRFRHIKIFTWIFPFGLYWNLIRVIKQIFSRRQR